MYTIGWFSSARGTGSQNLLRTVQDNITKGYIKAKISFVFCNRAPGQSPQTDTFFEQIKSYNIPLIYFSSKNFKNDLRHENLEQWRIELDREIMYRIKEYHADLSVLAGYMLVTGAEICRKYTMINLHPAAPWGPQGTWQEVIWKLIETNAKESGVMMHHVTPELDKGPAVTYCTYSIRGNSFNPCWDEVKNLTVTDIKAKYGENNNLFKLIRQHGLSREYPLITATIKSFSERKVIIENDKIYDSAGNQIKSYDLTQEIDKLLKEQD
ncbi:MAG: formyltransferase family protein [Chloroflexi bacterium]|nr:formyltransferase family protein [Chloroflexota bacterium]